MLAAVQAHRARLCDQLQELSTEQWETPSLCDGWRIRDVLGHLVGLHEIPTWRFLVGVVGMRGYHRRVDRFAREIGDRPPRQLIDTYRTHASSDRVAPIVGPIAPLSDLLVHSLDMQRPLALPSVADAEATTEVLARLCAGMPGFNSKRSVRGLRYEATDLGWSQGVGPVVCGAADDLLLAVMGRVADSWTLEGDGVDVLLGRR